METQLKNRIDSIDILRGIVMIIMALDHVRDYFHQDAFTGDPLDLNTTTPVLFFTRWITHFCAPVFVFLSGTSIYLQSLRKTKSELSIFLIKRGLWLAFAEVAIVTLGWTFNPFYNALILQVIWTIGISMVILGLLIRLPYNYILILGSLIVLTHNLLDIPESVPGFKPGFWWDLFHYGHFTPYMYAKDHFALIVYPFVPWTGLMMLGYCIGVFFTSNYSIEQRTGILRKLGLSLIAVFVLLRFSNYYGDPHDWTVQKNMFYTFLSFISVNKYPPSLLFMLVTIGPALLILAFLEKIKNPFTDVMRVYGRVAFFYYILHIYIIHVLATMSYFIKGHTLDQVDDYVRDFPFLFLVQGEGYGLPIVYLIWLFVVVLLYPACKWYDEYKTTHKEKWWLSYL